MFGAFVNVRQWSNRCKWSYSRSARRKEHAALSMYKD